MNLGTTITVVPFLHGNVAFAQQVRRVCAEKTFDCIAVDLSPAFADDLPAAVDGLPLISAVTAIGVDDPVYYVPVDPCDALIEAVRQSRQNRIPCEFIGPGRLNTPEPLPPLPDAFAMQRLGFDAYCALCAHVIGNPEPGSERDLRGQYLASQLKGLESRHARILALVHFRHLVRTVHHYHGGEAPDIDYGVEVTCLTRAAYINPDHLYFALGELPFVAGKFEKERQDPFALPTDIIETLKDLYRETRDEYYDKDAPAIELSPARVQIALTFLRNLTLMSGCFLPTLLDVVQAAKGVGGNAYALRILKSAKYYPYLPLEDDDDFLGVGIDKVTLPEYGSTHQAVNLFRDTALIWRTLPIKPEPFLKGLKNYRYRWNPLGMCSHTPEDRSIENFNAHVRARTLRMLSEDLVKSEKFTSSVKDGLDIRQTLRNWHTGDIYVKEIPPSHGSVDTVVIIFDETHDEKYTHHATWFAEHDEESTLTFYATDPFENLIGPGIARSYYGGLSLLFPPRHVPNAFELTEELDLGSLADRLAYGALMFSGQPTVAYLAARRPSVRLRTVARAHKKHLLWIPLSTFSSETLRRLRQFHVLNGKIVRSWASHFIGE